jgi:hypothetical protein
VSINALAECGLADEEGQGLGVGSAVGNSAIGANTGVGEGNLESGLVTVKIGGEHGSVGYLLGHKCSWRQLHRRFEGSCFADPGTTYLIGKVSKAPPR